ncbi:MAG: peptide deformylase [Deltaproteobacteria bacterium]|nr:peptide deformylase [Deltaproteobacteria bacterium]
MTLLKIAQLGEPVLRQRSRDLTRAELAAPDTQRFIDDLIETMHDADGAGLAAPQVFRPVRLCAIHVRGNNPRYPYKPPIPLTVLVNPVITPLSDEQFDNEEGCLSVADLRGSVKRYVHVRVQAWDRHGAEIDVEAKGLTAGTYQHECDHLDGHVFVDRVTDPTTFSTWKNWERHRKAAFVERATALVQKWGG